jgi:hypothetical protein
MTPLRSLPPLSANVLESLGKPRSSLPPPSAVFR